MERKYYPIFKALISAIGITFVLNIPSISIYPFIFALLFVYIFKHVEIKNMYIDTTALIFAVFLTMAPVYNFLQK